MKLNELKTSATQTFSRVSEFVVGFVETHAYTIPTVIGILILSMAFYLFCTTLIAIDETNRVIHSIPAVVQMEMSKTRKVLREESESNRQTITGQHETTREEISRQILAADEQRKRLKEELDRIERKISKAPPLAPSQKRQKVLGIF